MNIWQDSNEAMKNSIPNSSTAKEPKFVSAVVDGIRITTTEKLLDNIFGTPEEMAKEPKPTMSFRMIDLADERNNKGNN